MPKNSIEKISQKGFSLIEVLLASSIFAILVISVVGGIVYSYQAVLLAGQRQGAIFFAEEGLEATRSIRDGNFGNLSDGEHGLAIESGRWVFFGTQDSAGIYVRVVSILSQSDSVKQVTSSVTWESINGSYRTVTLVSSLGNWKGE